MRRIFQVIIGILLMGGLAFASDETPRFYTIHSFEKGLNSHASEFKVSDNQCAEAQNIRFNDSFGAFSKREALLVAWDVGSSPITSIHRYYKSDGTIKTIIASGATLEIGNASTTTSDSIKTGLTDGKRWQFVTYQDVAIGTNGYDQPQKYDGYTTTTPNTDNARTAGQLCAELGAPFAQLSAENDGDDLDASAWYQYRMAFYDGANYAYSNARSNPILTGPSIHNISLTDIPIGPVGTTQRYLFRTRGNADQDSVEADTTFYMVCIIDDNTTVATDDSIADESEPNVPTWTTVSAGTNVTPPTGSLATINNEKLFISGNKTYLSDIYWSDNFNPDYFDPEDYEQIRPDDGDEITFLKIFQGVLTVGKTNSIQKFYTTGFSDIDWEVSEPYSIIGCPAPYSADVTPIGIIYLGWHGLYRFDGQFSSLLSDAITSNIRDISQANIKEVIGKYHDNEFHLSYTSVDSGETNNNRELIYNVARDAYTLDTKNINCYASFTGSTDLGTLYSGSSISDGKITAHSGSPLSLRGKYQSDFDAGTYDDLEVYNSADSPILHLGWDCTVATWLTDLQSKNASISTVADIATYLPDALVKRPSTAGTWISPVYQINASALDKLYWHETLGSYGDITWQIRLGASTTDTLAASWNTAVSSPSGSDLSSITANDYIQLKTDFTTSDIDYSPILYQLEGYVFKLVYSKVGQTSESSILSIWESGWKNFDIEGYKKQIQRIKVFYKGTSGTLTFGLKNEEGDCDQSFDIDLSTNPSTSETDAYTGADDLKVYTWHAPLSTQSVRAPVGEWWKFRITENGVTDWTIDRIQIQYVIEEIYD